MVRCELWSVALFLGLSIHLKLSSDMCKRVCDITVDLSRMKQPPLLRVDGTRKVLQRELICGSVVGIDLVAGTGDLGKCVSLIINYL